MAARRPQTYAKHARELALRERRDRKRAKKAEAAAQRAAGEAPGGETAAETGSGDDEQLHSDDR